MIDLRDLTKMKLISFDRNNHGTKIFPEIPCVYFLFDRTNLEYIGMTKNLRQRTANHLGMMSHKVFDCVGYIEIADAEERESTETELILKYLSPLFPPYRKDFYFDESTLGYAKSNGVFQ